MPGMCGETLSRLFLVRKEFTFPYLSMFAPEMFIFGIGIGIEHVSIALMIDTDFDFGDVIHGSAT